MKKLFIYLILNLIIVNLYSKKLITSGYYVNKNDDTINCKFSLRVGFLTGDPDTLKIQFEIVTLDSLNNETVFKASDIKGFLINYNGKKHIYHSLANAPRFSSGWSTYPYVFLELNTDGYLKWYNFKFDYGQLNSKSNTTVITEDILKKGDEPITPFLNFGFGMFNYYKKLSEYFSEYPDLSDKIKQKVYREEDMKLIVKKYNQWKAAGSIVIQDTTAYLNVDTYPAFLFGRNDNTIENISDYFHLKIKIPSNCPKNTKVFFQTIIEKDGSLSNTKLVRGIPDNDEFNNSLLEIAKTLPKWKPGRLNDRFVRVQVSFFLELK